MLASLPKLADRNFIIGFFLPTLLATLVLVGLFHDVEPISQAYGSIQREKWEEITGFVLAVWVAAIVLMLLNHLIYRLAEGYVGPLAWLGRDRTARQRERLIAQRGKLEAQLDDPRTPERKKGEIENRMTALDQTLASYFPDPRFPTLPSRFGNVIRAFEAYGPVVYGVDSIPAWIRLIGVIPKPYASATADARAEVDFFLNAFALSVLVALLAGARLLVDVIHVWPSCPFGCARPTWASAWYLLGGIVVAWVAYTGAVWRAVAWGELVKGAFDLYLPSLARTLGYALPATQQKRREFWEAFNQMTLYFAPMDPEPYAAQPGETAAASPPEAQQGDDDSGDDKD